MTVDLEEMQTEGEGKVAKNKEIENNSANSNNLWLESRSSRRVTA